MKKNLYKIIRTTPLWGVTAGLIYPLVSYAQDEMVLSRRFVAIRGTLRNILAVLFVLATVVFLWGVIQFISSAEDETKRNKAKGVMTWGIIGLAVMAAAWGVVTILIQYFGVGGTVIPERPFTF